MQADFALEYDVLTVEQPQKLYLMARLASVLHRIISAVVR